MSSWSCKRRSSRKLSARCARALHSPRCPEPQQLTRADSPQMPSSMFFQHNTALVPVSSPISPTNRHWTLLTSLQPYNVLVVS